MTETQDPAKTSKKIAKGEAKRAKKGAKAAALAEAANAGAAPPVPAGTSPAERSAAAAERQVRLQRWRVVFAVLMFLVAAGTFLATVRPWERWNLAPSAADRSATEPGSP